MATPVADVARQVFVVSEVERGLRLDRFLSRRIPRMSRTSVQEAIAERVTISSGAAPKPSRQVFPGEVITIAPRPLPEGFRLAMPEILAEGDGWLVVDKPAGLATTPNASRPGEDLATRTGFSPAHRLDRFTSGCVLLTWTPEAARFFEEEFRERRVEKEYLAIVRGVPREEAFTIDAPLCSDERSRVAAKMRVARATDDAQPAITRCDVVACALDGSTSLVRARPLTGRRHQIRVHLAEAGHAIVGDLLYGGDERDFVRFQLGQPIVTPAGLAAGRHLLHAHRLGFTAPESGEVIAEAATPSDFNLFT